MGFKMVIVFMITRCRLICLAIAVCFGVAGCNKVPLLAPSGSTIVLTSAATALPPNSSTTIIAQVLEAAGTPPQDGTLVTFLTTLGSILPAQAETIGGRVTVTFMSGTQSGTATITAASGGATIKAADGIKIAIGAAAVGGITLSASPGVVPSIGGASTITATVLDAGGNPLSGISVSFTTDAGSVSPTVATTDTNGKAHTTLTTSKTAKVTATAGVSTSTGSGATATTTTSSATVTVTVNTTQAITIGTVTPASPSVGQTVSVPLTYSATSGTSPVTKVTVNWGDGVVETISGQPGVVSHAYQAAGSYVVQVTGTDSTGDTSTTSTSITVGPAPRPSVGITVDNDNPPVNTAVTFTVSAKELNPGSSGADIRNIHVDYGDGNFADLGPTAPTTGPKHTYTTTGTKVATATATDTNGKSATAQVTIIVK